jgi:hypothetical protein
VQRDFEELPQGAAQSLRDSLVTLLVKHCQGNAAVRTQLCLAIAALAAHLPAVQWGPTGVVGWLAQRLGGEAQNVSLPCMLELLTVLPQVRDWLVHWAGWMIDLWLGAVGWLQCCRWMCCRSTVLYC